MSEPWGIHRIGDMFAIGAWGFMDGHWGREVTRPYPATVLQRIRAAWWVLTERAEAVVWPDHGEIEQAFEERGIANSPATSRRHPQGD